MSAKINQLYAYIKYQLFTKGILFVIYPLCNLLIHQLLRSRGLDHLSVNNVFHFLLSFQGLGFLVLLAALLGFLVAIDINAFVILGKVHQQQKTLGILPLFRQSIEALRVFMNPLGVLALLYIVVCMPLVGIGLTITPMQNFQIPNFILDVIFQHRGYTFLYVSLMAFLFFLSLIHIFLFQYTLIGKREIRDALRDSRQLVSQHWKAFLIDFFGWLAGMSILAFGCLAALMAGFARVSAGDLLPPLPRRIFSIMGALTLAEILSLLALTTVPVITARLTRLFYRYHGVGFSVQVYHRQGHKGWLGLASILLGLTLLNYGLAVLFADNFDAVFNQDKPMDIIAHRGGGDLAAENSVKGMEAAYQLGASYSEIDVQRTADGQYIIHHDPSFRRLSGLGQAPDALSLAEIQELSIRDAFDPSRPSQPISTIDQFLNQAKGKIGLFIELKGKTADYTMVDDLVQKVKAADMLDEVVLVSLKYDLIRYAKTKYPDIKTGYIYFYALGDLADLQADILIMEEKMAQDWRIAQAHARGKEVVVWTVNSEESIDRFIKSELDGMITDRVSQVLQAYEARDSRSEFERILDYFIPR